MMFIREALKKGAFLALGSGLAASLRVHYIKKRKARVVLNLHRVSQPDGSAYAPLSPKLFEELLVFMKQRFDLGVFRDGQDRSGAILSFDDGYKDFIEVAAPILAKHKIAVNHNIIPECVESGRPPLNVMAQDFVGKAPSELVKGLDVPGFAVSGPNLGGRLSAFIKQKPIVRQQALAAHLLPQFYAWEGFKPTRMMNRADVLQIAQEHEIGAHSYSHANMGSETLQYLREDVQRCKEYFADLQLPMDIYAFPNGSGGMEHIAVLEECGIEHVLMVGEDFDLHPRRHFRFTFDAHSRMEMRFKALGGIRPVVQ